MKRVTAPTGGGPPLRRYVWTKRVGITVFTLLVISVVSWFVWERRERRLLEREVGEWKTAGLPIYPEDFAVQGMAADRNAAEVLRQAVAATVEDHQSIAGNVIDAQAMPWADSLRKRGEADLQKNRRMVELARKLADMKQVAWARPPRKGLLSPFAAGGLNFSKVRNVANYLKLDAELAVQRDDAERLVDDALATDAINRDLKMHPWLISRLVGVGVAALGYSIVYDYADHTHIRGPAKIKAAQLIEEYLACEAPYDHAERMLCCWAGYALEEVNAPIGGPWEQSIEDAGVMKKALWRIMRPMRAHQAAAMLKRSREDLAVLHAPSWAAGQAMVGRPFAMRMGVRSQPAASLIESFQFTPILSSRFVTIEYRDLATRRMSAVVLACRMYSDEHGGKSPATLAELVPEYLPRVPVDPFSANNASLGYGFAGGKAFVYSISSAQTDMIAAGTIKPVPADHADWRRGNVVLFVEPPRPTTPAKAGW